MRFGVASPGKSVLLGLVPKAPYPHSTTQPHLMYQEIAAGVRTGSEPWPCLLLQFPRGQFPGNGDGGACREEDQAARSVSSARISCNCSTSFSTSGPDILKKIRTSFLHVAPQLVCRIRHNVQPSNPLRNQGFLVSGEKTSRIVGEGGRTVRTRVVSDSRIAVVHRQSLQVQADRAQQGKCRDRSIAVPRFARHQPPALPGTPPSRAS